MSKNYQYVTLEEEIVIDRLYSFHYSELNKDYVYSGEKHDFWEFLYVDKGEVEIVSDNQVYDLKQGSMVFYAPNEFHSLRCNHRTPPNIFIIAFDCHSAAMNYFVHKSVRLGNEERQLLSLLIEEGQRTFKSLTVKPRHRRAVRIFMEKVDEPYFGSEQLIKIYLQALLIRLIRSGLHDLPESKLSTITKEKEEANLASRLESYMEEHLTERLTLKQMCSDFALGKTQLAAVFRKHANCGLIEFWGKLRIEKAKQLIREETCNVTEISERLGYNSVHYFSRQFKKATGMSPTEYLRRIKAKM